MIDLGSIEYLVALWYVGRRGSDQDWMAAAFRNPGDPSWRLFYRFRYYTNKVDAFDSDDRKSWWSASMPPETSEEELVSKVEFVAREIARQAGAEVERVDFRGPPMPRFLEIAQSGRYHWLHFRVERIQ